MKYEMIHCSRYNKLDTEHENVEEILAEYEEKHIEQALAVLEALDMEETVMAISEVWEEIN